MSRVNVQPASFEEVNESYSMQEAIKEAKRCLNCKSPQCRTGCPINNEIPDWIHQLALGNLGNAIQIINTRSNLPAVCGRVCAHERQCEGHCILGKKGQAMNIGKLERFVADFDAQMGLHHEGLVQKNRGRIAVIGSGPAGLTIAGDMARQGFQVEIFEMEPEPGGVLMFGIPEYRLPKDVVRHEIDRIKALGAVFHCNTTVGIDLTIDDLFDQGFDAIFMGTGTGKPRKLDIAGCNLQGVEQAIYFLRLASLYNAQSIKREEVPVAAGQRVFVVGCGNTAMDASRTAIRMGAKAVEIIYHRSIAEMSALRAEYDDAVKEGVRFNWQTQITAIQGQDGHVSGVELTDQHGTRTEAADVVILAVGQRPASRIVKTAKGIEVDERGYVVTRDMPFGMTTRNGVFAGGDVVRHPATVVHAMQNAKAVAEGMIRYVDAIKLLEAIS
ncbi:MAG: NAD(P)-dependent oxidoreductase [Desulfovibrio sp.]|nr:NAD(P)-dependent oxidoreductase [Desulfovibrio sp.]